MYTGAKASILQYSDFSSGHVKNGKSSRSGHREREPDQSRRIEGIGKALMESKDPRHVGVLFSYGEEIGSNVAEIWINGSYACRSILQPGDVFDPRRSAACNDRENNLLRVAKCRSKWTYAHLIPSFCTLSQSRLTLTLPARTTSVAVLIVASGPGKTLLDDCAGTDDAERTRPARTRGIAKRRRVCIMTSVVVSVATTEIGL